MNRLKLNMLYQQEQNFNLNELEDDGSDVSEEIPLLQNVPEQEVSSDKEIELNIPPQSDLQQPVKLGEHPVKLQDNVMKMTDTNNQDQGSSTQRVSKGNNKVVKKQEEGIEEVMLDVGAIRDNIVRQAQKKQQEYWKKNANGEIEDDDDGAHSEEPEVRKSTPRELSPDHYLDAQLVDESFEQQVGIQPMQQPVEEVPDPQLHKKDKDKENKQKQEKKAREIYKPHEESPPKKKQPNKNQKIVSTKFNMELPFEVIEQFNLPNKQTQKKKQSLYNPKTNELFQTIVGRQYIPMIHQNGNKETKDNELENYDDLPEVPQYNFRELTDLIVTSAKASARQILQVQSTQKSRLQGSQMRQQNNQDRLQQQLQDQPEHTVDVEEEPEEILKIAFIKGKRFLTNQAEYYVQYQKKNRKTRKSVWVPQSELRNEDIFQFELSIYQSYLKLMIEQGQEKQVPPAFRIVNGRLIVPKIDVQEITQSKIKESNDKIHRKRKEKERKQLKQQTEPKERKKRIEKEHKSQLFKTIKPKSELYDSKTTQKIKINENFKEIQEKRRTSTTATQKSIKSQIADQSQEEKVVYEVLEFLDADKLKFVEPSADMIKKMSRKRRDRPEEVKQEVQKEAPPSTTSNVKWIPPKKQPTPLEKVEDEALYIKKLKEELFQSPQRQNRNKQKKVVNSINPQSVIYDPLIDDMEQGIRKKRRLRKIKEGDEDSGLEYKVFDEVNDNLPLKRRLRPTKDQKSTILDADIMMIHFQELVRTKFGKNINILGHTINSQNRMVIQIQDGKEQTSCYVEDLIHTHTEEVALYLREQILITDK